MGVGLEMYAQNIQNYTPVGGEADSLNVQGGGEGYRAGRDT